MIFQGKSEEKISPGSSESESVKKDEPAKSESSSEKAPVVRQDSRGSSHNSKSHGRLAKTNSAPGDKGNGGDKPEASKGAKQPSASKESSQAARSGKRTERPKSPSKEAVTK